MKYLVTATVVCTAIFCQHAAAKPLKVYILAGQSNMEGHAKISTFDYIGLDPKTAPMLKEMRNPDGTPRICDDVWISYYTGWKTFGEGHGKLTVGYGARHDPTRAGNEIGPEFTFGIYMHKFINEPILLIKTAWGGKSLNTDFRPPSAGPYRFSEKYLADMKKRGRDIEQIKAEKARATGVYYRMMMTHVKKVLGDIKSVYPGYNEKDGYELAGFVWFQGWNDMCDGTTYPDRNSPNRYAEYSTLLTHFIRDVRKELNAPKMRFVIGCLGVGGEEKQKAIRKAMAAPATLPEFKGNVVAVETAPFWDFDIEATAPKQQKFNRIMDTAHALAKDGSIDKDWKWGSYWEPIGRPAPSERIWRFMSVEPQEKDRLKGYTSRRFRDITLPAGMEKWFTPEFDDSRWKQGKAPIGKGVWRRGGITMDKHNSPWGDGEFLLMRTSFDVDNLDYDSFRISVLARQGFHIYLNGQKICTYIWWKNEPYYRSIVLGPDQIKHLKKGRNLLAVYANDQYEKKSPNVHYASIDVAIEGITKANKAKMEQDLDREVFSARDRAIMAGASNGGYHYLGSAKILGQIGKAFAEAMIGK